MRIAFLIAGSLLLAGCVVLPPTGSSESYDPHLYDARGNVVPPVAAATAPAPECREIERTVEIGGKPQKAYATACRQPDGTWRFTN
jgi:surface antigen